MEVRAKNRRSPRLAVGVAAVLSITGFLGAGAPATAQDTETVAPSSLQEPDTFRFVQIFIQDAAIVENAWIEGQVRWQDGPMFADDAFRVGAVLAFAPLDKLEVGGVINYVNADFGGAGSESGIGDTPAYVKWQFFHNPIEFTAGLELNLPSGDKDKGLGTGEVDPLIFGSVRKNLAEAYLTGYLGFRFNGDTTIGSDLGPAPTPGVPLQGKTSIVLGGGAMFPVTDRLGIAGELTVETERYESSDSAVELTASAMWLANENLSLRGGLGLGLADGAPDWQVIFGIVGLF